MFEQWLYILAIVLHIAPFSYLRFYPYRMQLRIPAEGILILYIVILLIEIHIDLMDYPLHEGQAFLENMNVSYKGFFIIYACCSFSLIKADILQQLYMWFPLALTEMSVLGLGIWIEQLNIFPIELPRFLVLDAVMGIMLCILMPLWMKYLDRIEPFLFQSQLDVWKWGWIPAAAFFFMNEIFVAAKVQSVGITVLGRVLSFMAAATYLFFMLWLMRISKHQLVLEQNLRIAGELSLQQKKLAEDTEQKMRQAQVISNHIGSLLNRLERAAEEKDEEKVRRIISEGHAEIMSSTPSRHFCRHELLDAILCTADMKARQRGIRTEIKVSAGPKLTMEDMDICVLFGNLLENAMDACLPLPVNQRWMTLRIECRGRRLAVVMDNSCRMEQVREENGIFFSSKRNYAEPGIGLASIQDVVKKYGGTVRFSHRESVFSAEIFCSGGIADGSGLRS